MKINRREFLRVSAAAGCAAAGFSFPASPAKSRIGFVRSTHAKLGRPSPLDDPLDYARVRDMVWTAIEYGRPAKGPLGGLVRPGSWVVVKPNIAFLGSQESYRSGDITDFRVTRAVIEFLARRTRAARVTVAEGGSYQAVHTKGMWEISQNGVRVDARTFDWGPDEFPGWGGTLDGMLRDFAAEFPGRTFDYVNLNLDALRDASGAYRYLEVPKTSDGAGAFGARSAYCITRTVHECDFLINVPVMKVHSDCGLTACLKNYVGTAPREVYAPSWRYSNRILHDEYSVEDRIDGWVVDLGSFHPADYSVVDGLRGLQYANHNNGKPDQMIRSNLVLAGEDAVALDALVARLMAFNPWDLEFLHMAERRGIGSMDPGRTEVVGDEPDRAVRPWIKASRWHGRCNREWTVGGEPGAPSAAGTKVTIPTDTLHFAKVLGEIPPGKPLSAAMRVRATAGSRGFLWLGVRGRAAAFLNGTKLSDAESADPCHVGQFKIPIELPGGESLFSFRVEGLRDAPQLSALLTGPGNDGDTMDGIRYLG